MKSEPVSPPRDHHQHNSILGQSQSQSTITTMGNAITNQSNNNNNNNNNMLNHPQQHLIMNSRPSSTTGHLTPNSGKTMFVLIFIAQLFFKISPIPFLVYI